MGLCGGLERTELYNSFYFGSACGGLERTDLQQFLLWDYVVVLKEADF